MANAGFLTTVYLVCAPTLEWNDSIWSTIEQAQARADVLNGARGRDWSVMAYPLDQVSEHAWR